MRYHDSRGKAGWGGALLSECSLKLKYQSYLSKCLLMEIKPLSFDEWTKSHILVSYHGNK